MKLITDRWITGVDSLRTSTIRDHAKNDQHQHAISILCKENAAALGGSSTSSPPIVTALTHLSHEDRFALRKKFDVAFVLAKEKLFFRYNSDSTLNSEDKAKIVGYYRKWTDAKYLLGCAVFSDMLTPCAILSN